MLQVILTTGRQILIAEQRILNPAAPRGKRSHPDDANAAMQRKTQHIADAHRSMRAIDDAPVDAHMASLGGGLRKAPRFRQPDEPKKQIEPNCSAGHKGVRFQRIRTGAGPLPHPGSAAMLHKVGEAGKGVAGA